jgi:bifunctional DNase/RNase
MIGAFESQAIQQKLEGVQPERPMTHDLIRNIITRVGGEVDRIVIDDFWNAIYYAKIYVLANGEEIEIDARPSDAVAIAIRFGAPIYVADAILDMPSDA